MGHFSGPCPGLIRTGVVGAVERERLRGKPDEAPACLRARTAYQTQTRANLEPAKHTGIKWVR